MAFGKPRRGAQPIDVRYNKCIELRSNDCWSKLEMYMLFIQWLSNSAHLEQHLYANVECKHERSPRRLHTRIQPSDYCTQNRDSSQKPTMWHSWTHIVRSVRQSHSLSLCCIVKGHRSNGRSSDSPRYCQCQCTIWADTGHIVDMSIFWVKVCDFVVCLYRANFTIYLLSRASVLGRRWHSTNRSVSPSTIHWFHIRMEVVGFRPVSNAILRNYNLHSW